MDSFNHIICASCGGKCCKTMPGSTSPEDWGADRETILERLITGLRSGKWVVARNQWVPGVSHIIPLLTGKGCIHLTKTGCALSDDERPSACRAFIPDSQFPNGCHYPSSLRKANLPAVAYFTELWRPYQDLIGRAIEESRSKPIRRRKWSIWPWA